MNDHKQCLPMWAQITGVLTSVIVGFGLLLGGILLTDHLYGLLWDAAHPKVSLATKVECQWWGLPSAPTPIPTMGWYIHQ